MHYRLSSIKGVRFRFANFASHFIRIEIFQIDFTLILSKLKYFNFTKNGASVKLAILSFFPWYGLYFHHTKNQPPLRPRSTFSEHWPWFWPYLLSEKVMKFFWYKIWVKIFTKSAKLSDLGIPWVRNNRLLLDFFYVGLP